MSALVSVFVPLGPPFDDRLRGLPSARLPRQDRHPAVRDVRIPGSVLLPLERNKGREQGAVPVRRQRRNDDPAIHQRYPLGGLRDRAHPSRTADGGDVQAGFRVEAPGDRREGGHGTPGGLQQEAARQHPAGPRCRAFPQQRQEQ